jgi:hypothetical protein
MHGIRELLFAVNDQAALLTPAQASSGKACGMAAESFAILAKQTSFIATTCLILQRKNRSP